MLFAQVFLGFVFVVAAVPKLLAPNRTAAEIRSFQVLGDRLSNVWVQSRRSPRLPSFSGGLRTLAPLSRWSSFRHS